jgi:large subunit ribosomal protein L31
MKADIHPNYGSISISCSCGNTMDIKSTASESMHVDVCSQCHPFFTGKQKDATTGGRIDRFNKRFGAVGTKKDA